MKYAIIGCGRISPNHIAAAKANDLNIVAVYDLIEEKMDETIINFELPANTSKHTVYHEILKIEQPDLVAICTESGSHGSIALDCLDAEANLIIEKPLLYL